MASQALEITLCAASLDQRELMGQNGRLKMEKEFDEQIVIQKYLRAIGFVLSEQPVL
jgi:hypothetical protein